MRWSPWFPFALSVLAGCATVPAVPSATIEAAAPGAPTFSESRPDFAVTLAPSSVERRRAPPAEVAPIGLARAPDPRLPAPSFSGVAFPEGPCGLARDMRLRMALEPSEVEWPTPELAIENPDPGCRSAEEVMEHVSCTTSNRASFGRTCDYPLLSSL
jgi:hypothetical protein